jgi:hypothetical protein
MQSREQLGGNVSFNVAYQMFNQLGGLVLSKAFLLRVAITGVAKLGTVKGKVDVFGKSPDRVEGLRKRCSPFEDGFDDIALAAYDYVSLTTVSYLRTDMGRIAREMVQRRCQTHEAPFETVELQLLLVVPFSGFWGCHHRTGRGVRKRSRQRRWNNWPASSGRRRWYPRKLRFRIGLLSRKPQQNMILCRHLRIRITAFLRRCPAYGTGGFISPPQKRRRRWVGGYMEGALAVAERVAIDVGRLLGLRL